MHKAHARNFLLENAPAYRKNAFKKTQTNESHPDDLNESGLLCIFSI